MHRAKEFRAVNSCFTNSERVNIRGRELRVIKIDDLKNIDGSLVGYTMLQKTNKYTHDKIQISNKFYRVFTTSQYKILPNSQIKYCICVNEDLNLYVGVLKKFHNRLSMIKSDKDYSKVQRILLKHKRLVLMLIPSISCFCIIGLHLLLEPFRYKTTEIVVNYGTETEEVPVNNIHESITAPGGTVYQYGSPVADVGKDEENDKYTDEQSTNRDIMGLDDEDTGLSESNEDNPESDSDSNSDTGVDTTDDIYSDLNEQELIGIYTGMAEKHSELSKNEVQGILQDDVVEYTSFDGFTVSVDNPIVVFENRSANNVMKTFIVKIKDEVVWEAKNVLSGMTAGCNMYDCVNGKSQIVTVVQQCKSLKSDENTLSAYNNLVYESEVFVNVQSEE